MKKNKEENDVPEFNENEGLHSDCTYAKGLNCDCVGVKGFIGTKTPVSNSYEGTTGVKCDPGVAQGLSCNCGGDKGDEGWKGKYKMEKVERMGMDDSKVATRLLEKNWSPLLVRKYQLRGWPLFLGIITDCSISSLDTLFYKVVDEAEKLGMFDQDLQNIRNFVGFLSDKVIEHFDSMKRGSVEGVAIMWYVDKCAVASSLFGDHMVHKACRDEFYFIIGMLPHI